MLTVAAAPMAVGMVGLLVDPAVEQICAEIADHDPAQHGQDLGLPGGVGHQIEAHYAEHHARGEAQEKAYRAVRGAVDHGGQSAAQGQSPRAGQGGDEENLEIRIHAACSYSYTIP